MTTICLRSGIMASDSGIWLEETLSHKARKLYRLKDGSVVGFCGSINDALNIIRWLNNEEVEKVKFEETTILVATPKGKVLMYDDKVPVLLKHTPYVAIGTGASVALGALYHGATAVEAVKAAIYHDSKSRGPIFSMKVHK
jgi:20S proteasome alpha/beta subunit